MIRFQLVNATGKWKVPAIKELRRIVVIQGTDSIISLKEAKEAVEFAFNTDGYCTIDNGEWRIQGENLSYIRPIALTAAIQEKMKDLIQFALVSNDFRLCRILSQAAEELNGG